MKKFVISFAVIFSAVFVAYAQENAVADNPEKKLAVRQDSPLKILEVPKPAFPDRCITGTVRVRVQFLASGKIGEVVAVSQLGYGAAEMAVEAAKKIKFEPAFRGGKAVTIVKIVPVSFTIY